VACKGQPPFQLVHELPNDAIERKWRACLAASDYPTHYAAPEFFLEPMLRKRRLFAVLSMKGEEVTGVLTGINDGGCVQSGLSVRPQIAFSRTADRERAMTSLMAGLVAEAKAAKLVDLFVWSDMEAVVPPRFRRRRYEGVVMLDLSRGPDALFRQFSQTKRNEIRRAIKSGVSVDFATNSDDISGYYHVYLDWSRRKAIPFVEEDEFQELFALSKNRRLLLARYRDQIIAGAVVRFVPGGVAEYAANSSLEGGLQLRPNDLLQWRAIEWACAQGMTKYSLGGTHLFLRKFGGEIVPTIRCRLDLSLFRRFIISR
jgi:Acetyltransferase (GNAT) domain